MTVHALLAQKFSMSVDLHTHSSASDGVLSPPMLLARARHNGVAMLALTDHDNVAGVRELQQLTAQPQDPELVAGVEISAQASGQDVHVVGLWIDADCPALGSLLGAQAVLRGARAQAIGERLARKGLADCYAGALLQADGAAVSRPHFARHLVAAGHCRDESQAFKRWLGRGKAGDVRCEWPGLASANAAIHAAGGLAVLAHPLKYRLSRTRLDRLLAEFREAGGDAVELVSGAQAPHAATDLLKLMDRYQLVASTGSDFHSPAQTWCDVGQQLALPRQATAVWELRGAA
ncbi:MAG: PHP domain-containing protein [Gammaproteobacteria bacterium]|nr:PHP domain-containing protein [Gammaproteobacteria bacterium]